MKNKLILFIICTILNLQASTFGKSSLNFETEDIQICSIYFKNKGGIYFKNEEPQTLGHFRLFSTEIDDYDDFKSKESNKINLKLSQLLKSENLQHISNNDIYLVFNKSNKISLSYALSHKITLRKGKHSIYIEINKELSKINAGTAKIDFNFKSLCLR